MAFVLDVTLMARVGNIPQTRHQVRKKWRIPLTSSTPRRRLTRRSLTSFRVTFFMWKTSLFCVPVRKNNGLSHHYYRTNRRKWGGFSVPFFLSSGLNFQSVSLCCRDFLKMAGNGETAWIRACSGVQFSAWFCRFSTVSFRLNQGFHILENSPTKKLCRLRVGRCQVFVGLFPSRRKAHILPTPQGNFGGDSRRIFDSTTHFTPIRNLQNMEIKKSYNYFTPTSRSRCQVCVGLF